MRMLTHAVILILFLLTLVMISSGSVEASTDSSVESEVTIHISNGTAFLIEFSADVEFLTLPANEMRYSRQDILQASPEILGAIKYALKSDIVNQIKSSFPSCQITSSYVLPQYDSNQFYDEYNVQLTADFFSLNASYFSSDLINGLLDAGVFVNYSFPWTSLPGWNNTFTTVLSDDIGYKRTNGDVDNKHISWDVINIDDNQRQEIGTITLLDLNPTTDSSQNETVSVDFLLDCRQNDNVNMTLKLKAHRLDMSSYNCLPSILSLPASLPADAIRLCMLSNLTTLNRIKTISLNEYINDTIELMISSNFNQSFNLDFSWDDQTTNNQTLAYNIDSMDEKPPLIGLLMDPSVDLNFFTISGKAFFGLINAGAVSNVSSPDVNFAEVFDSHQLEVTSILLLPPDVLFNQEPQFSWNQSTSFEGIFTSENPPRYKKQNINRTYDIKVKSTDLNLLSFFSGKTEVNLGISFEKTRNIFVMKQSSLLSIPQEINLPYINADAFRLCVQEEVFDPEEIDFYIKQHESELENVSRRLFPSIKGSAINDQQEFIDSLQWDNNISSMIEERPVRIMQKMESTAPLNCQFSIIPPQFTFDTQNLTFIGIPDETVTYNMTFPKGISINVISSSPHISKETTENGQSLISVKLNASDTGKVASIMFSMEPTFLYIIGLFVPCIISIFITLLLFVVVYMIRKKRNIYRQNKEKPYPSDQQDGYENEEYYIPPKPPSSRK